MQVSASCEYDTNKRLDVVCAPALCLNRSMTNEELSQQIAALTTTVTEKFDRIDTRFEQIDKRFEDIDGRLNALQAGQDNLRAKYDDLVTKYDDRKAGQDDLRTKYDELNEKQGHIVNAQKTIAKMQADLQHTVEEQGAKLEEDFTDMKAAQASIQHDIARINRKMVVEAGVRDTMHESVFSTQDSHYCDLDRRLRLVRSPLARPGAAVSVGTAGAVSTTRRSSVHQPANRPSQPLRRLGADVQPVVPVAEVEPLIRFTGVLVVHQVELGWHCVSLGPTVASVPALGDDARHGEMSTLVDDAIKLITRHIMVDDAPRRASLRFTCWLLRPHAASSPPSSVCSHDRSQPQREARKPDQRQQPPENSHGGMRSREQGAAGHRRPSTPPRPSPYTPVMRASTSMSACRPPTQVALRQPAFFDEAETAEEAERSGVTRHDPRLQAMQPQVANRPVDDSPTARRAIALAPIARSPDADAHLSDAAAPVDGMDRGFADQPPIATYQDEAVCRSGLRARGIGNLAAQLCAASRPPVRRAILRQLWPVRALLEDGGDVRLGQCLESDGHGVPPLCYRASSATCFA